MCKFRLLNADEIECRIGTTKTSGVSLLLYKDARCDMAILDETVGSTNWQRTHEFKDGKLYCTVSLWDDKKNMWIEKEDVGTESNTEAEKGQASDSFKRACVNWGIGRELYTSPFIWISGGLEELKKTKFSVQSIAYDDKNRIASLVIVDDKGSVRYSFPKSNANVSQRSERDMVIAQLETCESEAQLKQLSNNFFNKYKGDAEVVEAFKNAKKGLGL